MANRKLVDLYPQAKIPKFEEYSQYIGNLKKVYGELPITFFKMPIYKNPIGIEVECEGFYGDDFTRQLFSLTNDQSLKKAGVEFVSVPLKKEMIDYALVELKAILARTKVVFGHRTSIHVHVNVSEFSWNQLVTLVALYALLEEVYFSFVDSVRRGNTFCYPIIGTSPIVEILKANGNDGEKTTKYCAFNIAPIATQMTVEFRHLEGTKDAKKLRRWIQVVTKLVNYVDKLEPNTCRQELLAHIQAGTVQEKLIPRIWGHTAMIFNPSMVARSIENGSFWAVACLLENK